MQDFALKKCKTPECYPLFLQLDAVKLEEIDENAAKNCDEIFVEYLSEVAGVTNPEYFASVVKFTILYRECLNEYGWLKMMEAKEGVEEEKNEGATKKVEVLRKEYCTINNCEFVPELANELVLVFLPGHTCGLSTIECINLVVNFCEWLLNNGYTCTKVSTVKK